MVSPNDKSGQISGHGTGTGLVPPSQLTMAIPHAKIPAIKPVLFFGLINQPRP